MGQGSLVDRPAMPGRPGSSAVLAALPSPRIGFSHAPSTPIWKAVRQRHCDGPPAQHPKGPLRPLLPLSAHLGSRSSEQSPTPRVLVAPRLTRPPGFGLSGHAHSRRVPACGRTYKLIRTCRWCDSGCQPSAAFHLPTSQSARCV